MTDSESKARKFLKSYYSEPVYIKKIPDYKVTGSLSGGLPDYLLIKDGFTYWYEIKSLDKKKKSFNPNSSFTNQQLLEFTKMTRNGAIIYILITYGNIKYIIEWSKIYSYILDGERKSIPIKLLEDWNGI